MTSALERAYASAENTPLATLEIIHTSISGGVLRLVSDFEDLEATIEDSSTVTFTAAAFTARLAEKSSDGQQQLDIAIDNTNNLVWNQLSAVITANRLSESQVILKFRPFFRSDASAPAGAVYSFAVKSTSINTSRATIRASYNQLPDISYPTKRYYTTQYPGLKYV